MTGIMATFIILIITSIFVQISFGKQVTPCASVRACENTSQTSSLYGCTNYDSTLYHCDPISNEFVSTSVDANYSKVVSATREPSYIKANFGNGFQSTPHSHETLRADIIKAYNTPRFSIYLSIKPAYDKELGNRYVTLASYRNGLYVNSPHTAGWIVEFVPNKIDNMKTVRFSVFNTNGTSIFPNDVNIPVDKFSEVTGTFDGKSVRFFLNGTLQSEIPFIGNYSGLVETDNFLKIAGEPYCVCHELNDESILDEVRYYNYSLNGQQINHINPSQDVPDDGLIGYWKFDGDLKDYSAYKNDMFYNTLISSMVFTPDGRLFYSEKNSGNIRIIINETLLVTPFASIPEIHVNWEQGLLGLAIDSKFPDNHFVYAYYNYIDEISGQTYARVIRLTDSHNKGINQTVILDKIPASNKGYHTGEL